jgi:NADH-quinone oxidoreductase subunit E
VLVDHRLQSIFAKYRGSKDEIIPLLQAVQEEYSYIPEDSMLEIARFTRVPESKVYGAATFYAQFRFTPMGENRVMVCRGTACHVKGAPMILEEIERELGIKEGETTADGRYSLETVACIGCCSLAPCIMINKKVEANMTPKKVAKIFKKGGTNDTQ